jgi:hypothetical protein
MIPKDLLHSIPEISLELGPNRGQTSLKSRQIRYFFSLITLHMDLSLGLVKANSQRPRAAFTLPFLRPCFNHKKDSAREAHVAQPPSVWAAKPAKHPLRFCCRRKMILWIA